MIRKNRIALIHGMLGFLLTFLVLISILSGQFIEKYSVDLFGKNLDTVVIIKFTALVVVDFVNIVMPISIFVMAALYHRKLFRSGKTTIKYKSALLVTTIISITCFFFAAFVMPGNKTRLIGLLYDIQMNDGKSQLERTDLKVFQNSPMCKNYSQLGEAIDSLSNNLALMDESDSKMQKEITSRMLRKTMLIRSQITGFPFLIFILYYAGMFVGILNRRNKLVLFLPGIYFIIFPGIYYLSYYFENRVKLNLLSATEAQLYYLSILTLLTIVLYILTKKQQYSHDQTETNKIETMNQNNFSAFL